MRNFTVVAIKKCGLTAPKITKNGNFWYKFAPKGKLWGSTEKLEYRCTTTNLPACNNIVIVLKILLLHSVSVITNFVIPKRDKQTNKQTKKTSHFFVYSRRATHDPHHTWHGDRGGPYHFCTQLTFFDPSNNFATRGYWKPASVAQLIAPRYALPGYGDRRVWIRGPGWLNHCVRL